MKKLFLSLILLFCLIANVLGVSYKDTNLTVLGNGQSLYGKKANGLYQQIIGISTANNVVIDSDKGGVILNGFLGRAKGAVAKCSATNNATITPAAAFQPIDTYLSAANSTCNLITTANIPIGSLVYFNISYASQNIVFAEGGNMYLGAATRTLTSPYDLLVLLKVDATTWVESGFYDNN